MNTDNFDNWYDEQKEKIMQKYNDELKKGVKKDAAEKNFRKKMQLLHKKYNNDSEKILKQPKLLIFIKSNSRKLMRKTKEIFTFLAENFGDEQ